MSTHELAGEGTPWLLLAIYLVLAGQLIATETVSQLTDLTLVVSLLPAAVGFYLTVQHFDADDVE